MQGDPGAVVLLASLAGQFAWHAELLFDLLPVRDGIDRDALVASATRGCARVTASLDAAAGGPRTMLTALERALVPLEAEVRRIREGTDARTDGPRVRALTLIGRDLRDARDGVGRALRDGAVRPSALDDDVGEAMADLGELLGRGT